MPKHPRNVSLFDMLHLHADAFLRTLTYLSRMEGALKLAEGGGKKLPKETGQLIANFAKRLRETVDNFNVPATIAAIDDVVNLSVKSPGFERMSDSLAQIDSRFQAELKGRSLLILTHTESNLVSSQSGWFGEVVDDKFPNAAEDIIESSRCQAFGRYTASVFHLMRAMECAVQELASELNITNLDREWGKLLSDMKDKIEAFPRGEKRDAWSESHSLLYHVKQAWRNKTMHPKKTYTEEEAEGVRAAVKSFMAHLATLLTPKATH